MSTLPHTSVTVFQWSAPTDDKGRGIAEAIAVPVDFDFRS